MTPERPLSRSLLRPLLITLGVLAIPLVANQFVDGEGWSAFDFALMGGLVFGAGVLYEFAVRKPAGLASAMVTAVIAAVGGAAMVAGEVDDAPGLVLLGIVFVGVAATIGVKVRRNQDPAT